MHELINHRPPSPEAEAFLTAALEAFREKQQRMREHWHLDRAVHWDYEAAEGRLVLELEDGSVVEAACEPIGSFIEGDHAWEWAFNNSELGGSGEAVRSVGTALGLDYLTTGVMSVPDETMLPFLAAVGLHACGGEGVYIGDAGDGLLVLFALRNPRVCVAAPVEAPAPSAFSGAPSVLPVAASAATGHDHTLLFTAGKWEGRGTLRVSVVPEPIEVASTLTVTHGAFWEIDTSLGEFHSRYTLKPLPSGVDWCEWASMSEQFGPGAGRFSVVEDLLLAATESEDGTMRAVESFRRISADEYESSGALYMDGERYSTWRLTYRRT